MKWRVHKRDYEGLPLFLRHPVGLDASALMPRLPVLLTITLEFAVVRADGLPAKAYNDSIEALDLCLVKLFEAQGQGITVLVETFGGRRMYYKYIAGNADVEQSRSEFSTGFPSASLAWETQPGSTWKFIRRYAEEFELTDLLSTCRRS